jgi:hypothetical protein
MLNTYDAGELDEFKRRNKIALNIYYLGPDGPQQTETKYLSIYTHDQSITPINLGYITSTDQQGNPISHFVIINKVERIWKNANYNHVTYWCPLCQTLISDIKYFDNHYKKYHVVKESPDITFPKLGENYEKFDITKEKYLKKTCRYKFILLC